jgi:hypothetical protein
MKRTSVLVYLSLLANVVLFFHKPLFSSEYMFPWDFRGVQLPLISFLADELHANRFALWNPYSYCGYPVFANIEACYFHPLVLASAFISAHTSLDSLPFLLEWIVVLQVWVAGIATYYLLRELGAGPPAAWAGAVIFQTGGFLASRVEHIPAMMAAAWMPLAWLAILRLRQTPRLRWLAALGGALGMSVLGGFPQATLAVFVSTALLSILLVSLRLSRAQLIAYAAYGCVLGLALAAVQFIPTAQLTQHSVAKYRADWLGAGGGLRWESLVSLISPNHYNLFDMRRFKGPGDATFLYLYSSIGGLLLALYAVVFGRNRYVALLAIMALFGMFWMLGDNTPVWRALYPLLPEKVRIGIHPEYTYCIFSLAIAALAAMGLQSIRMAEAARWVIAMVIAVDLFMVGSGRPMNCASVKEEPGVTRDSFDGSAALMSEVRRYVNRDAPPSRIDTMDASLLWSACAPLTRVPAAGGVSPLALENVIQLRLFLHDGFRWGWYYPVEKSDSPVLDVMSVKYLMTRGEKATGQLRRLPRYRHVASLPGNELFENLLALPRFFLVHNVQPVTSIEPARALINGRQIDLRQTAITDQVVTIPLAGRSEGAEKVEVVNYLPASLDLAVTVPNTSFLVLSESYYPGWRAWLDGKPAPIYRADIAFRGVVVPAGAHCLRMQFRPVILLVSLAISLSAGVVLIALVFRGRTKERHYVRDTPP